MPYRERKKNKFIEIARKRLIKLAINVVSRVIMGIIVREVLTLLDFL